MLKTFDAKSKAEYRKNQQIYLKSRKAEIAYSRQLRQVAKQVGSIVKGFVTPKEVADSVQLQNALSRYSEIIRPWAFSVSQRMIADVARRDATMWAELGADIGEQLRGEIETTPTGELFKRSINEQVDLITSLPREAAQRVHKVIIDGISTGARAATIAQEVLKTGKVTESRAMLIARTETSRIATELTAARAKTAGCTHFTWKTASDMDVRPSHKALNNKIFAFSDLPIVDGEPLLPGGTFNCRCYLQPILNEVNE